MRRILLAIGIIVTVAVWHLRLRFPFDDVFISFRYAEHMAQGYGLVWNIGGPHTEGFTNLLFVLLLAAFRIVSTHLLAAAQAIGLLSTIASGILIFTIITRIRDNVTGLLATAFFWITPLTWINALSGMETSLFVLLCLSVVWLAQRGRLYPAFAVAFLATLTRPEAGLLGFVLIAVLLLSRRFEIQFGRMLPLWSFLLCFIVPLGIYALWKLWYFGNLFPNSFYVKVTSPASTMLPGLQYVRLFIMSMLVLLVLSFGMRKWRNSAILIASLWALLLLVFYMFVLPLEGLYDRFLWPAFAMLCITAAIGARDFAEWRKLRPFPLFACIVLGMQLALSLLMPRTKQAFAADEEVWDVSIDPIVRELKMLPDFDSLHFAYGDAGYVVYKSGIDHIDLFGLNDTRIALARSIAERKKVVFSERPDILLLPIVALDTCEAWVEDAYGLARTKEFQPVSSTRAFPFRLVWVLNTESPYYGDCKRELLSRIGIPGSAIDSAPPICYFTR